MGIDRFWPRARFSTLGAAAAVALSMCGDTHEQELSALTCQEIRMRIEKLDAEKKDCVGPGLNGVLICKAVMEQKNKELKKALETQNCK